MNIDLVSNRFTMICSQAKLRYADQNYRLRIQLAMHTSRGYVALPRPTLNVVVEVSDHVVGA